MTKLKYVLVREAGPDDTVLTITREQGLKAIELLANAFGIDIGPRDPNTWLAWKVGQELQALCTLIGDEKVEVTPDDAPGVAQPPGSSPGE